MMPTEVVALGSIVGGISVHLRSSSFLLPFHGLEKEGLVHSRGRGPAFDLQPQVSEGLGLALHLTSQATVKISLSISP